MMLPGLMDGMGGINYTAIQITFDMCGIKQEQRLQIFPTIIKLIDIVKAAQKKDNENAS